MWSKLNFLKYEIPSYIFSHYIVKFFRVIWKTNFPFLKNLNKRFPHKKEQNSSTQTEDVQYQWILNGGINLA